VFSVDPGQRVADPEIACLLRGLGQVDRGFGRLKLAEQDRVVASGIGPVVQQAPGDRGDVAVAGFAPAGDPGPDLVDEVVRLDLSAVSSANSSCCWTPRLRGRGTGTKYELSLRPDTIRSVMPSLSNAKCLTGG
jgi:hypothetical protein